jgi:hypothetical protein
MLEDLRLVRKGEPPTHARRAVDLDSIAKIEETARTVDIDPTPVASSDIWKRPLMIASLVVNGILVVTILILLVIVLSHH